MSGSCARSRVSRAPSFTSWVIVLNRSPRETKVMAEFALRVALNAVSMAVDGNTPKSVLRMTP